MPAGDCGWLHPAPAPGGLRDGLTSAPGRLLRRAGFVRSSAGGQRRKRVAGCGSGSAHLLHILVRVQVLITSKILSRGKFALVSVTYGVSGARRAVTPSKEPTRPSAGRAVQKRKSGPLGAAQGSLSPTLPRSNETPAYSRAEAGIAGGVSRSVRRRAVWSALTGPTNAGARQGRRKGCRRTVQRDRRRGPGARSAAAPKGRAFPHQR